MTVKQRLVVGILLCILSFGVILPLLPSQRVYAISFTQESQIQQLANTLEWQDAGTIVGTYNNTTIVFKSINVVSGGGGGCSGADNAALTLACFRTEELTCADKRAYVTPSSRSATGVPISGSGGRPGLHVPLQEGSSGGTCTFKSIYFDSIKSEERRDSKIARLNENTLVVTSNTGYRGTITTGERFTRTGNSNKYLRESESNQECQDAVIVNGSNGTLFELEKSNDGIGTEDINRVDDLGRCRILSINGVSTENKNGNNNGDKNEVRSLANQTFVIRDNVGSTGDNDAADANQDSCETTDSGPLGWLFCPLIDGAATFTQGVFDNFVQPFLEDVPVTTNVDDPSYQAWKSFRLIGNIVLVGTMMAIVYAQVKGDR